MRVLSANDLREALPMREAIEAMREAFIALSRREVEMPLRSRLNTPDGVVLAMPAFAGGTSALKIVSVYGGNIIRGLPAIHAVVLVLDGETGQRHQSSGRVRVRVSGAAVLAAAGAVVDAAVVFMACIVPKPTGMAA